MATNADNTGSEQAVSATPSRASIPQAAGAPEGLGSVLNISVVVKIVLGSTNLSVGRLMALEKGAVIRLDHRIGDPVDMQVNGRILARGELVVKEDDLRFGLKITEIVGPNGQPAAKAHGGVTD